MRRELPLAQLEQGLFASFPDTDPAADLPATLRSLIDNKILKPASWSALGLAFLDDVDD